MSWPEGRQVCRCMEIACTFFLGYESSQTSEPYTTGESIRDLCNNHSGASARV